MPNDLELFKQIFRLAMGLEELGEQYAFQEIKYEPECKSIQVECFNRKLPSDFYKLSIMNNNNDVFLEADVFMGEDGYQGYIDQPVWNQAKIHRLVEARDF